MRKYGFTIVFVLVALINVSVAIYQFTHNDMTLGAINTATVAFVSYLAYVTLPEKETTYAQTNRKPIIATHNVQKEPIIEEPVKETVIKENTNTMKTKSNRETTLLVSSVMSLIYIGVLIYIIYDLTNLTPSGDTAYDIGTAIGTSLGVMMLYPHIAFVVISFIFNVVAYIGNLSWSSLVAAILYIVAMVLMPTYFFGVIIQMILCFIGYSKLKKSTN